MEYEKKYKESLAMARDYYKANLKLNKADENLILEDIFPELKESEDEREELINYLKGIRLVTVESAEKVRNWIVWLEKQGDNLVKNGYTKNKDYIRYADKYSHEIWRKLMDNFKNIKDYHIGCNDVSEIVLNAIIDTFNWLEKQGEQKPTDSYCKENCRGFKETGKCFADGDCEAKREAESNNKNEPKFHEGDWAVNNTTLNSCHILKVEHGQYICDDCSFPITKQNEYHLWTIHDAKDGDVLIYGDNPNDNHVEVIMLFKSMRNAASAFNHFHVYNDEFKINDWCDCGKTAHPATKEQRELLFKKMHEAGYEWNAEKKELKKIKMLPTEWSEEDKRNMQNIDSVLFYDKTLPQDTYVKLRNFLKSLKQRIGG